MIFLALFFLFQSIGMSPSFSFERFSQDSFGCISKCIIDGWRGKHEFLPGMNDLSKFENERLPNSTQKKFQMQNGAIVNLMKKEFLVLDVFNLSLTCKQMQAFFVNSRECINDYWLKNRYLTDKKKEKFFQMRFAETFQKRSIKPVSYLQIAESHDKKRFGKIHDTISLGNPTIKSEDLFNKIELLFIGVSSEKLFLYYKKESCDLSGAYSFFYNRFFFHTNYLQDDREQSYYINNILFLITASLAFFLPFYDLAELKTVKERFSGLKVMFCNLTNGEQDWDDKKTSLDSINYPDEWTSVNSDQSFLTLWSATQAIFLDFFKFNKTFTQYDKQLLEKFSNEQKLLFFYCKMLIGSNGCDDMGSHYLRDIKYWILESCYESIRYLFRAKYKKSAIDFFATVQNCSDLRNCKEIAQLLSPLLNAHDVTTFFSLFEKVLETDKKVKQLEHSYQTLSRCDIAKNFYLLLQDNWEEQFDEIAHLNADANNEKSKIVIELTQKCCAFENTIKFINQELETSKGQLNENQLEFAKYKTESDQKLENTKSIFQEKIRGLENKCLNLEQTNKHIQEEVEAKNKAINELKAKHDQAIKNNNSEQSKKMAKLLKKRILKIFVVVQLCLIFAYWAFFKYMSYRPSCVS